MISLIGNRPAIQVGRHQVLHYDTVWLGTAVRRAAEAAGRQDFPFVDEIRLGIEKYLETKCPVTLLPLDDLFDRVRHMLVRIGCESIADKLEPAAPPVTLNLTRYAREAGNGFELAFFTRLRTELTDLRTAGAEEIRFTGLRECARLLCGTEDWSPQCETLLAEVRTFLGSLDRDRGRPLRARIDTSR